MHIDTMEKKRAQHCTETEEINVNFVYPRTASYTINKYNILHTFHQSKLKNIWNALHQSELINAWTLNVFQCTEYLRQRSKLFHARA